MPLTLRQEEELSKVICSLHPHKAKLRENRIASYIIRKGWGAFNKLINQIS